MLDNIHQVKLLQRFVESHDNDVMVIMMNLFPSSAVIVVDFRLQYSNITHMGSRDVTEKAFRQ